jgi:tripartite motif-containing protein 2/3/tripartite motif-containing protein 71
MLTGARVGGRVQERGRGQYDISYQPVTKGRSLLHIRVEGENISGSPFDVGVASPFEYNGVPIRAFSVVTPRGVAFNRAGEMIVSAGDSVSTHSLNGTKLRSFGNHGSGPGQLAGASGVAVDDLDNILVVNHDNHCIQKFTSEGQFVASVGTKGVYPLQFYSPSGVAFNACNKKVYVADTHNHRIQVINSDFTISSIIGGQEGSKFSYPQGVACDRIGNMYIADSGRDRIQVFNASGKFLRTFGTYGRGTGEFDIPTGVAVDARGMVFVSEVFNNRVSVFTTEGQYVSSFGKKGKRFGEFSIPGCLAMDDYGVLAVCDQGNDRVQIF